MQLRLQKYKREILKIRFPLRPPRAGGEPIAAPAFLGHKILLKSSLIINIINITNMIKNESVYFLCFASVRHLIGLEYNISSSEYNIIRSKYNIIRNISSSDEKTTSIELLIEALFVSPQAELKFMMLSSNVIFLLPSLKSIQCSDCESL